MRGSDEFSLPSRILWRILLGICGGSFSRARILIGWLGHTSFLHAPYDFFLAILAILIGVWCSRSICIGSAFSSVYVLYISLFSLYINEHACCTTYRINFPITIYDLSIIPNLSFLFQNLQSFKSADLPNFDYQTILITHCNCASRLILRTAFPSHRKTRTTASILLTL